MVSEDYKFQGEEGDLIVLILVVVEDGLRDQLCS